MAEKKVEFDTADDTESTPLLPPPPPTEGHEEGKDDDDDGDDNEGGERHPHPDVDRYWSKLRTATRVMVAFRRSARKGATRRLLRMPSGHALRSIRGSVRGPEAFAHFPTKEELDAADAARRKDVAIGEGGFKDEDVESSSLDVTATFGHDYDAGRLEPVEALTPLVTGNITSLTGHVAQSRPPSTIKSLPAYAPYCRMARHRSFYLWWINEFRHWWKSSRLLVRMAGLGTYARDPIVWLKLTSVAPYKKKRKKNEKNTERAMKLMKKLGRGGPMRGFLQRVHPFTRSLRILVAAWRWVESAQCRRLEVGVEEALAFIGNRVSRMIARTVVDTFTRWLVLPSCAIIYKNEWLPMSTWHPAALLITLGVVRGCAPYAASFQGSRVGRVLTREYFRSSRHRWQPLQRVSHLNLRSDDCCEKDEISENSDLAKLAKVVAKALGTCQQIGVDGMAGQGAALEREGFHQVGAGSGGYAVYECHRLVWYEGIEETQTLLLHITPYGPSILDVMPRYIVLEREDSVDRRNRWSEFLSRSVWTGPPVLEGYCYLGAFFSPHHFAELKGTYDKQLVAYDAACQAMCKNRTGRRTGPPTDLPALKGVLVEGKRARVRRRNAREYKRIQRGVRRVGREMKKMMSVRNQSSRGLDAWTARAKEQKSAVSRNIQSSMGGGWGGECDAPLGVILYFEGLDCAGKSSTGGLIQQALVDAGYNVEVRIYNRPPTAEQRKRPWMDRFEVPATGAPMVITDDDDSGGDKDGKEGGGEEATSELRQHDHVHNALVWDRGPGGDFVYGNLAEKPIEERKDRYREFMAFDRECFDRRILFCKLLFVTNRDSIASTLGKRLAQRKMARDLRTWLKASRGGEGESTDDIDELGKFPGLDEIDMHIDPTDFVAFNNYETNLHKFVNFAINTESEENPWIVVNTANRYRARKQLLNAFRMQLDRFKSRRKCCRCCRCCPCCRPKPEAKKDTPGYDMGEMFEKGFKRPWPLPAIISLIALLLIVYYYVINTDFDTFAFKSGESSPNVTIFRDD